MARTEKDFLNTIETYVKVTQARLRDGRIIDANEELQFIEKMISQRKDEVNGTAAWENIREKALKEMMEEQACAPEIGEEPPILTNINLVEVADAICDKYCKYPDTWDAEAEGKELSESEICQKCPLNRL